MFPKHKWESRTRLFVETRPWPAFGWQGLVGWSGRVHLSRVHFSRLASRLRRSAQSNCARIVGICRVIPPFEKCLEMGETHFFLFIDTFEKCLEMGEMQFSYLWALLKSV